MSKILKDLLNEYLDANVGTWDGFNADYWYERFIKKYDKTWGFSEDEKDEILEYLNRLEMEYE